MPDPKKKLIALPASPFGPGYKPKPAVPFNAEDDAIREYLNSQDKVHLDGDGNLPIPLHAPPFRQEPLVVGGDANFARMVDEILKLAPNLRGNIPQIRQGPSEAVLSTIAQDLPDVAKRHAMSSPRTDSSMQRTNLMGMTTLGNGPEHNTISINPNQLPEELLSTLVHEMTHAAGWRERGAQDAETHVPGSRLEALRQAITGKKKP